MWYYKIVFLFLIGASSVYGNLPTIHLGGLFDENVDDQGVFNYAVNSISNVNSKFSFSAITKTINDRGPFGAMTTTCSLLKENSMAIFGPKIGENIDTVNSICDNKDILHVITRWVYKPMPSDNTINFYPHADTLILAYFEIVTSWKWKSFTVLYENNESLLRMGDLIKMTKNANIFVSVKQLVETDDTKFRPILKEALQSGETNFVIDCSIDILEEVLRESQQVGMMTSRYKYFITNLDMQTIELEPFQYCEANISGIRLVNPDNQLYVEAREEIKEMEEDYNIFIPENRKLKTETALLIDAVRIVAEAIKEIKNMSTIENFGLDNVRCDTSESFRFGTTLYNYVKGSKYTGLTGFTTFDAKGCRSKFDLDVLDLHEDGIKKIGTWNSTKGLSTSRDQPNISDSESDSLRNKTFIVITCLTDPYGMLKETSTPLYGNDRYEGFAIDLIHELSLMEGFNYTFIIREDKSNGAKDANTGQWSGMIGDVMQHRADLAITDLTITSERETAVDFTSPFMNLGISILAKKPGNAPPSFFSFADPFAIDTWIMLALAYAVVSVSLFIMGRLCPDEWTNPYPCIEEPEFLINQFSLQNSAWFAVGSLMQQGTEIAPIAMSTRMVAGMWWFFVLIMVSSYTANLAAFLTTENPINLFTDVQSLVENQEKHNIRMGAKAGGATASFFKGKEDPTYKKIAEYMKEHPEDMVKENKDGVTRAEEDQPYAFFMESTSIEYETQRHCELQTYGKLLDDKGYGIAMRKNSSYRKTLSTAILKLQSAGVVDDLKRKWWEERKGGGQCSLVSDAQEATPLNLKNVEGVFYVTIGGTVCSIFFVIIELIVATLKSSIKAKISFMEALRIEIKAFMDFNSNVKPAINGKSESKSTTESPKGSESFDNNVKPAPYGFIPIISTEQLINDL